MVYGFLIDHCAERRRAVTRVTGYHRFRFCCEPLGKGLGNFFDDDDSFRRHAYLTLVHERTESSCFYGFVQICIFEHNERCLSAKL